MVRVFGDYAVCWTPSSASADSQDHGVHALHLWHVTDMAAKRELLKADIGWGTLPDYMAQEALESGTLVRLPLED
ncbi:LysR substrate-binding domain-containing protein [Delftia sp. ASV31]|uniref:LysR substrate-binding domain-containing protein n=1 Tax=Delftia sp. ASV31 TaxID=2795113 RepID=UPI0035AB8B04